VPTLLRLQGFRFFFYSQENDEPSHVHVEHGDNVAKYWLAPVRLASSSGFRPHELKRIRVLVMEHRALFEEAWYAYFGN
jgi:hypothetical protein